MKNITIHNYEAYLLDDAEGNLSPWQAEELGVFLNQHPHLKTATEDIAFFQLKPPTTPAWDKTALLKVPHSIASEDYEALIIAELEGENTAAVSADLKQLIQENPEVEALFLAYQNIRLVGTTISYPHKKTLIKTPKVIVLRRWLTTSAAAVLVLLFSIHWFSKSTPTYEPLPPITAVQLGEKMVDEPLLKNSVVLAEKKIPLAKKNSVKNTPKKATAKSKKMTLKKEPSKVPQQELHVENLIVEEVQKQPIEALVEIKKEPIKNENLMATNNVSIIYEDEVIASETTSPTQQKISKLRLVRMAIKRLFQKNIKKGKEKMLFAMYVNPFARTKKRRMKQL